MTTHNMIARSGILLLRGNHDLYFYSSNDWIIHVRYWHKQQDFHLRCDNIWLYELRAVDRTGRIYNRSWLTGKFWASSRENLILLRGNNKDADQIRLRISTVWSALIGYAMSGKCYYASWKKSLFLLVSVAEQIALSATLSQTSKTSFNAIYTHTGYHINTIKYKAIRCDHFNGHYCQISPSSNKTTCNPKYSNKYYFNYCSFVEIIGHKEIMSSYLQ